MAMGHERSKPLHNFNLPCGLKWGNQKFLRCAKVDSNGVIVRRSNGSQFIKRRRKVDDVIINHRRSNGNGGDGGGGGGIAAVREKLMFDLQAEADKMKYAIFRDGLTEDEKEVDKAPETAVDTVETVAEGGCRPWNLRTRRAACKAPINGITSGGGGGGPNGSSSSPLRTENKSPRLRSEFAGAGDSFTGEKRKRATFSVSLNRKEIEEDFMEMVGHRPTRRPKKRAKMVQKNMDTLFPGLWLTEITPDLYKVPDDH